MCERSFDADRGCNGVHRCSPVTRYQYRFDAAFATASINDAAPSRRRS
jgi:hypothetical protein